MSGWRRPSLLAALGATAMFVGGCGLDSSGSSKIATEPSATAAANRKSLAELQAQQTRAAQRRLAQLPKPTPGTVTVAAGATLGITSQVSAAYEQTSPGVTVSSTPTSATSAFRQLCTGRADIAEATRPMSASELALCSENGITFNTDKAGNPIPIELAADGIVVATKNQSDAGGDCVRRSTLRDMFAPGSSIDNWGQLSFDSLHLGTAGRSPATDVYQLFANLVLGSEGDASLSDIRAGYQVRQSDDQVRALVTGSSAIGRVLRAEHALLRHDLAQAKRRITAAENAASAQADKRVLAQIAAANAARARTKAVLSDAQKQKIASDNARMDASAKAAAANRARQMIVNQLSAQVRGQFAARLHAALNPGVAGVFRFSYYELYEEQLRPLEIWDPVTTQTQLEGEGVATSGTTATENVATRIRQQAGGGVGTVKTLTFPATPTAAGASYVAAGEKNVKVPAGGPVNLNTTPNCVFPSRQTITSGVYPLSVRLLAFVPKSRLARPEVINYLSYYLGQGQDTVAAQRLVPLDDKLREQEYQALTGHPLPQSVLQSGQSPPGPLAAAANAAPTVPVAPAGGTSPAGTSSAGTSLAGASGAGTSAAGTSGAGAAPASGAAPTANGTVVTSGAPSSGVPGVG